MQDGMGTRCQTGSAERILGRGIGVIILLVPALKPQELSIITSLCLLRSLSPPASVRLRVRD
jgi:hypothetical protein